MSNVVGTIAALNASLFVVIADAKRASGYSADGVRDLVVGLAGRPAFLHGAVGVARLEFDGEEHAVFALQLEAEAGYASVHRLGGGGLAILGSGEEHVGESQARAVEAGPSKNARLAGVLHVGDKGIFVGECAGVGVALPRKKADVVEVEDETGSLVARLAAGRYAVLVEAVRMGAKATGGVAFVVPVADAIVKGAKMLSVVTDADAGDAAAAAGVGEEPFGVEEGGKRLVLVSRGYAALPEGVRAHGSARELDAHYNEIAALPSWLGELAELRVLNLHQNALTELPAALGKLRKLTSLGLGKNRLEALPDVFGGLRALKAVELADNPLGELPASFFGLSKLEELDLSGTKLRAVPERLRELVALKELNLRSTKVTELPSWLAKLPKLEMLHVGKKVSLPPALAAMTRPGRRDLKVVLQY